MTTRQLLFGTAAAFAMALTTATPAADLELVPAPGSECAQPGETVTVTLELTDSPAPGSFGYEAFLGYDDTLLTLTGVTLDASAAPTDPFPIVITDTFNTGPFTAGELDIAAGVCLGALVPPGCGGPGGAVTPPLIVLATLTFTVDPGAASCTLVAGDVVGFRAGSPALVADSAGADILGTTVEPVITLDGAAPSVTCPADLTAAECASSQTFTEGVDFSATDTCDPATAWTDVSVSPGTSVSVLNQTASTFELGFDGVGGPETVTITYEDACGNVGTCTFDVTVVDTAPPSITCPAAPADIPADAACQALVPDLTGGAMTSDNCSSGAGITVTQSPLAGATIGLGATIVTLTAQDEAGLTNSCDVTVTVVDTAPPSITCPAAPADIPADAACQALVPDLTGGAMTSDNCSSGAGITVTQSPLAGATIGLGATIVTLTAQDEAGLTDSCDVTVTVVDTAPPSITCPAAPADIPADAACQALVPDLTGGAMTSDNCSSGAGITVTQSPLAGATIGLGATIVTLTAQDEAGLTDSCDVTVTVVDGANPVVTCPADVTIECDASTDPANTGTATATDNCDPAPVVTFEDVVTPGSCAPFEFTIARTWTATDSSGHTDTCLQTISVADTTAPILTIPPDVTLECDTPTDPSGAGEATATDNCDAVVEPGPAVIWINEFHYDNGGIDVGEFIEVAGAAGTDLGTTDVLLYNGANGTVYDTINLSGVISDEGCGFGAIAFDAEPSIQNGAPDGIALVRNGTEVVEFISYEGSFTATNGPADGLTSVDVGVAESFSTSPGESLQRTGAGEAAADFGWVGPAADSRNLLNAGQTIVPCGTAGGGLVVSFADAITPGACPNEFTITRTWTATDSCGNASSLDQVITVDDTTPPALAAPANVTIECDQSTDPSSTGVAIAPDACDPEPDLFFTDVVVAGACPGAFTVTRTWTATDDCGNSAVADQVITVQDSLPPVLTLPPSVTVDCNASTAIGDTGSATAVDACDTDTPISAWINEFHYDNDDVDSGEFIEVAGSAGVDLSAYELYLYNGNDGAAYDTIALAGLIPDEGCGFGAVTFPLPANGIQNGPDGIALVEGATNVIELISYEGAFTAVGGPADGMITTNIFPSENASPIGTSLQRINAGDRAIDFIWDGPIAESPGLLNSGQSISPCGGAVSNVVISSVDSIMPGSCPHEFVVTRTWTATDECGNADSADQTITVVDDAPPTVSCPPDPAPIPGDVTCGTTVPDFTAGASVGDDCSPTAAIVVSQIPAAGTAIGTGVTFVTVLATDECGNIGSCSVTVTVFESTPPSITCPAPPADIPADAVCNAIAPDLTGDAIVSDNCSSGAGLPVTQSPLAGAPISLGSTLITLTVTDEAGNTSSCDVLVTVVDNDDPKIICPAAPPDIAADAGCQAMLPDLTGDALVTDNCTASGALIVTQSPVAGTTIGLGATVVTLTVEDAVGLIDTCDVTVTVIDATPPAVTCPTFPDPIPADAGGCIATVSWSGTTADDACDGDVSASLVYDIDVFDDGSIDVTVPLTSGPFPVGTHRVTARASDAPANEGTCDIVFTVIAVNEVAVTVQLENVDPGPFDRCITFEVFDCTAGTSLVFQEQLTFVGEFASVTLEVPCEAGGMNAAYTCITAKDALHTLRRTIDPIPISGGRYVADFVGSNELLGGNLNADAVVDIFDFGVYTLQYDTFVGADTTCAAGGPHADLSGDGFVDIADFTYIQGRFLQFDDAGCCMLATDVGDGVSSARLAVSVSELEATGLAALAIADLNADGMVDQLDIVAFVNGARPETPDIAFIGADGGNWNDSAGWASGAPPDAATNVAIAGHVMVDGPGALARNVRVASVGHLHLAGGALAADSVTVQAGGILELDGPASLLTVSSLIFVEGSSLLWNGGVIEIVGGTYAPPGADLVVGDAPPPSVLRLIAGASTFIEGAVLIGVDPGDVGRLEIDGLGTSLDTTDSFIIGAGGDGTLVVSGRATAAGRDAVIGRDAGAFGEVIIADEGSRWTLSERLDVGLDGTASLRLEAGGRVTAPMVFIGAAGEVHGPGVIEAPLSSTGRVATDAAAGSLTINGDYVQEAEATLDVLLDDPAAHAGLLVSGTADLDGAVVVDFTEERAPAVGDTHVLMTATAVTGRFAAVVTPAWLVARGLDVTITYERDRVILTVIVSHDSPRRPRARHARPPDSGALGAATDRPRRP